MSTGTKRGKVGAPLGNKNALGKRALGTVGGFITGIAHNKQYNEASLASYKKRGLGVVGYKVGMLTRRVATFGIK